MTFVAAAREAPGDVDLGAEHRRVRLRKLPDVRGIGSPHPPVGRRYPFGDGPDGYELRIAIRRIRHGIAAYGEQPGVTVHLGDGSEYHGPALSREIRHMDPRVARDRGSLHAAQWFAGLEGSRRRLTAAGAGQDEEDRSQPQGEVALSHAKGKEMPHRASSEQGLADLSAAVNDRHLLLMGVWKSDRER